VYDDGSTVNGCVLDGCIVRVAFRFWIYFNFSNVFRLTGRDLRGKIGVGGTRGA